MIAGEPTHDVVPRAGLGRADDEATAKSSSAPFLQSRLDRLQEFDGSALREEWRRLLRSEPPRISRDLLIRALAYRLQELELGGLPKWARQSLAGSTAADPPKAGGASTPKPALPRLKPGARLVREWHGRIHSVIVLDDAFEFDGQRYGSLTKIAREITDAHWSGPRFFGLAKRRAGVEADGAPGHEDDSENDAGLAPSELAAPSIERADASRAEQQTVESGPMVERQGRSGRGRSAGEDAQQNSRGGRVRCAIYTRKSSEEGLEQEFNSLDAQREACEAYVRSQKHEGWQASPVLYDDPGYSGGNMDRPALKRLLADIAAKTINVVVVYKVDRLTRSLTDFAKIVDIFDGASVSFVSITQAFNTTTSMGRLTLNVLLSFAQFEREVTGERIRDKIAASKKRGLWMGGQPALGYDVRDRKLIVNEAEAETVRAIFRRYLDLGSVRELKAVLDAEGVVSKHRTAANGEAYGGQSFSRGALYQMLQNPVYRGEIAHKGAAYPGEHSAIVEDNLWRHVQEKLEANGVERSGALNRAKLAYLLAGILFDAEGEAMTPTHAVKKGVRYRYYVSRRLITDIKASGAREAGCREQGQRLPAGDLERLVIERLKSFFADPDAVTDCLPRRRRSAPNVKRALCAAAEIVRVIADDAGKTFDLLRPLIVAARVHPDRIAIELAADRVTDALLDGGGSIEDRLDTTDLPVAADDDRRILLTIGVQLQRAGMEMRFLVDGVELGAPPDAGLVRLLTRAHSLARRFAANPGVTLEEAGAAEAMGAPYAARLMRLNFLAPDVVIAILNGRQPAALTATKLMADTRLPLAWTKQRKALGFA